MLTHEKCFRPWKLTLVFIGVSQVVVQYFGHLMQRTESFEKTILTCFLLSQKFCMCQLLSPVQLFATPWTVAHKAPLSMEFSRQEYWSGLPFPIPGDLPDAGIQSRSLVSPALAGGFFTTSAPGKFLALILQCITLLFSLLGSQVNI